MAELEERKTFTKAEVEAALGPLMDDLTRVVDRGLSSGEYQEVEYPIQKWRIEDLTYEDGIPSFSRMSGQTIVKRTWDRALIQILNTVTPLPCYAAAESALPIRILGWRSIPDAITIASARALLEDRTRPCPAVERLVARAVEFAGGARVTVRARMHMASLRIRSGPLRIETPTSSIELSAPTREDLEVEIEPFPRPNAPDSFYSHQLSAIGRIESHVEDINHTRREADRLVCALRLYRACSAKYLNLDQNVISPLYAELGMLTTGDRGLGLQTMTLGPEDAAPLQRFASEVWTRLPVRPVADIRPNTDPPIEPVSIAYDRYCDALTLDAGLVERRIANAVMGLEALYLTIGNEGELSYRLRIRVGRVLETLGIGGGAVVREIRSAYGIRSAHVHGSRLDGKGRASIAREYGDVSKLLNRVLDDLRISIDLYTLTGVTKDSFIHSVDSAFASDEAAGALRDQFRPVRERIPMDPSISRS